MDYKDSAKLDTSQMGRAAGGGGRGGGIAIGGGAGLIIMVVALLFGFNPNEILGGQATGQPSTGQSQSGLESECQYGSDIRTNRQCRWVAYQTSIQQYWQQTLQGYQPARTVLFSGQVSTACGTANSQVGPFYCPGDTTVYIDTAFADQLLQQLGALGGDPAEAYILAHEYGHHVSNLTGDLAKGQQGQRSGPKSAAVRVELQADCYAGAWFKWAVTNENDVIENVTQQDLERITDASAAVGDDRIQSRSEGQVTPESWTHGSSAMRKYWVAKGFNSGDPAQCDTFATDNLGG